MRQDCFQHERAPKHAVNGYKQVAGTSLVVQGVRHRAPNAGGPGLIPGPGNQILYAAVKIEDSMCRN